MIVEKGDFFVDKNNRTIIEIDGIIPSSEGKYSIHNLNGIESNSLGKHLEPIEIDDKFLLDNGFYVSWQTEKPLNKKLDSKGFYNAALNFSILYSEEEGYGVEISRNIVRFRYVHELQHLMRFIGETEFYI